jgi:GNAT superfamily N-acetyltransferase
MVILRQIEPSAAFATHHPDAHWTASNPDGAIVARCSLWWTDVPSLPGHRLGVIGHYDATDTGAAVKLLECATDELRVRHCTLAVGPMDGNTWRRYRLVTTPGVEPPFFMEPTNPIDWVRQFEQAGFGPLATYESALNTDLARRDERADSAWTRFAERGITIRQIDSGRYDAEMRTIYRMSCVAFTKNHLYTPIAEDAFVAMYRPILPHLRPELTLMAESDGRLIGYSFTVPNLAEAQRGNPIRTVIVKTVAVLPERTGMGLGAVLIDRSQKIAHDLGYTRAIHALMHESNRSRNISRHTASVFRRYTLFAKPIAP